MLLPRGASRAAATGTGNSGPVGYLFRHASKRGPADAEGTVLEPLGDSVDRLFALCSDGTIWLYYPYPCWQGDEPDEPPYWHRLPDLAPDP